MQQFLNELSGQGSTEDVIDLCIDHPLIVEDRSAKFTTISGLEAFPALENLSIAQHELNDLKGLPIFAQLKELNLSQNELESLLGFSMQPKLKTLDLTLNNLTSLEGFPDLPLLEELHLSHNHLQEIDHLPVFPLLNTLNLAGNKRLRNVWPLNLQPQLTNLNALRAPVQNWSFLDLMPQLQHLAASPHQPDFHRAFSHNSQIRSLTWEIRQLEPQLQLPDLHLISHLSLKGGKTIRSIQGWEALPKLEALAFDGLSKEVWNSTMKLPKVHTLTLKQMEVPPGIDWGQWPSLARLKMKKVVLKNEVMEELLAINPSLQIEVL